MSRIGWQKPNLFDRQSSFLNLVSEMSNLIPGATVEAHRGKRKGKRGTLINKTKNLFGTSWNVKWADGVVKKTKESDLRLWLPVSIANHPF